MEHLLTRIGTASITGLAAGGAVVLASFMMPPDVRSAMQGSAAQVAILSALFAAQIRELRARDERHDERLASVERKVTRLCKEQDIETTDRYSIPPDNGRLR